jgi:hypothetical protein
MKLMNLMKEINKIKHKVMINKFLIKIQFKSFKNNKLYHKFIFVHY